MYPTGIFDLLNVAALQVAFGAPVRIYPMGEAPPSVARPYAVYQLISGVPSNCIDDPPDSDDERVQFSVWADTLAVAATAAQLLRTELEPAGYVNNYQDVGRDPETTRYGFVIDWSRLNI